MSDKFISERNLKFLLYEVFDTVSLTQYPYYSEHSKEVFDMALETALKIGKDLLRPHMREMDLNPPEFLNNRVEVHPAIKDFIRTCGEGGWTGANAPMSLGGMQLPLMIAFSARYIFSAANYSASVYVILTGGSAHLIETFGSEDLKQTFVPKMLSGQWTGTMAMTEPQAGSSLSDLKMSAEPTDNGYYKMQGQKIFITGGDHNAVENIVHLMLARIKGAPPGVKGLSLFVIPKKRMDETGQLVSNDVQVAGIYHKLGYRGAPLTQLSLGENGDCRGYLLGEPNKGLSYMFQMMNEARIDVGLGAASIASAAYYASLAYTKERPQGRPLSAKDPSKPQVRIIEHPDIRRMLLFQRAVTEGALSLLFQCTLLADLVKVVSGDEKEKTNLLLEILTPVAKSYPSEMGVISVSQGLQCLGGYGYCDEFPLEQHFRDARIHPIHEGTTGIQGLDLLGRKVRMHGGRAFDIYVREVQKTIDEAMSVEELKPYAQKLSHALGKVKDVTAFLINLSSKEIPEKALADATLYLEFFGIVVIAWQWIVQAIAVNRGLEKNPSGADADFYHGKLYACRFFYAYELPKTEGLAYRLTHPDGLTVDMQESYFSD